MKNNLRKAYLDYFHGQKHTIVPSDSLVPSSDPSLLFTSAGMVQFKAHFLQQIPLTFTRATSSQRCLRTTDIDSVGLTARHLTFFEMLGNFSFGDYFKEDAIAWAWEFFTKTIELPKERLWISVYKDDDEAQKIWKKFVPESRIVRMGEESNFWTMGPTGPCGPCSEIYWDKTGKGDAKGPDDSDRWMEVWNLVFTQFDRQADGSLLPLPKKNIDTGMGLERLTSVVEGVQSNFDTSLLKPLVQFGENMFSYKYGSDPKKDISLRIVADHIRAVTFLVFDGILPSNEGRGYVLRRLLRRATRQGTLFGKREPFLFSGAPLVSDLMKDTAPDLPAKIKNIADIIKQEEERFLQTIDTGSEKLREMVDAANKGKKKSISGADVFRLYDTFGFPPELTKEMLAEKNLSFDQKQFEKAQSDAQSLAREGWKGSGAKDVAIYNELKKSLGTSTFRGYEMMEVDVAIAALIKDGERVDFLNAGDDGELIAAQTPFYPEGGGQVGDKGFVQTTNGELLAIVSDTHKPVPDMIGHLVQVKKPLKVGDKVRLVVDKNHRNPTRRHHTATHLLHAALRRVLGTSVTQAGSLVAPDRLRFDYTHNKPMTADQIVEVENIVNNVILENLDVTPKVFPADQAKKMGAMALFGEKYGNEVRCLLISNKGYESFNEAFSLELCGGTHVNASGDIGAFKIISDSSLAAGVRRIEAIAGLKSIEYIRSLEKTMNSLSDKLKTTPQDAENKVVKLLERQKQLEQEIRDLRLKAAQGGRAGGDANAGPDVQTIKGVKWAVSQHEGLDAKDLRTLADRLRDQIKSGVVFVSSIVPDEGKDKVSFVFSVTPDVQKTNGLDAGKLAKTVATELKGSGGGRADFAQGGGQGRENLASAIKKLLEMSS